MTERPEAALAPTGAPPTAAAARQRRRAAAAFWRQAQGAAPAPTDTLPDWSELARLPEWVHQLAPKAARDRRERITLACGLLWHGPAWRRCVDPTPMQALAQRLGAERLDALLHARVEGPGKQLPTTQVTEVMQHAGQLVLLSTLARPWAPVVAQAMGWTRSLDELARVPPPEETPRTVQLAARIVAAALDTVGDAP